MTCKRNVHNMPPHLCVQDNPELRGVCAMLAERPLRLIACAAQMSARLWVWNGEVQPRTFLWILLKLCECWIDVLMQSIEEQNWTYRGTRRIFLGPGSLTHYHHAHAPYLRYA